MKVSAGRKRCRKTWAASNGNGYYFTKVSGCDPAGSENEAETATGAKVVVLERDVVVHLVPLRPIKEMRGFASEVKTSDIRDEAGRI